MSVDEVIRYVKTPEQARDYLNHLKVPLAEEYLKPEYNKRFSSRAKISNTFKNVHDSGKAVCLGHALSAAALLKDDGYSPVLMFLDGEGFSANHIVYPYKKNGKLGALGTTSLKPKFDSLSELKNELIKKYPEQKPEKYWIADLDKSFPDEKWIYGYENLFPTPLESANIFFFSER